MKRYSIPLLFVAVCSLAACGSAGNPIVDPEKGFRNFADSWIGKPVESAIGPREECTGGGLPVRVSRVDDKTDEQELSWKCYVRTVNTITVCDWAVRYDRESRIIASWRYVGNKETCLRDSYEPSRLVGHGIR